PFYMSPEQAGSGHKEIDSRSDIFSLGITLYEALTFMRPFNGRTSFEIIKEIVHHEPRNPIKENRSVPRDLATICLKALEKEPDCRYLSMQEFADDLRSFLSGLPILARPSGPVRTTMKLLRHHKFLSISLASACMTLVAFSIVLYQAYRHQQDQEAGMAMMFQPVHQALGWSARDLSSLKSTENWLRNTAPENPDTSLLMAIRRLEENRDNRRKRKESLMEAMDHLRYATGKYKEQGEQPLLGDCRYLMGVASLRLAQEPDVSVIDRDRLRAEGEDALEKANDAAGPDSLVWRASTEKDQGFPSPIRLNTEHTLAHLYRGVDLFEDLYQGGKRSAFDETSHYLEKVLESRPHNITALFCLGRLYFFWARTYQSYELLDPATDLLERAILEASESSSYYMIPVTLGQIELLKGNDKKAETYFQLALEQIRYNDGHIHNIYCNLGKIAASRGEWEKAHEQFRLALEQRPDDPHVNIELGECFLLQGDPAAAMPYGLAAEKQSVAGAFLLTARICMARKDYATAVRKLKTIAEPKKVIPSAYDRALASLLVGVVPPGNYGIEGGAKTVALKLAESACYLAKPQLPPICLSAMGVADLLNASYSTAIEMLLKARETRNGWGQSIRSAHGWEDACDLFFLAMAHTLRSRTAAAQPDDLERAAEYQRQGESLYNQLYNEKMELADLVKAVCTRSRSLSSD
ncbi:MAG: tetratricopeptide repeat protein, partial [Planctomycetota bacterium]